MSRRRRSTGGVESEKRDQALRLAVAATTLGMTMGIAPASVLGAEEAVQPASKESPQVQDSAAAEKPPGTQMKYKKYEKVELTPAAMHKDQMPGAVMHKGEQPGAAMHKGEIPGAVMHKGEQPGAAMRKGEQPEAATQKSGQASGAGGPKYDLATTKK